LFRPQPQRQEPDPARVRRFAEGGGVASRCDPAPTSAPSDHQGERYAVSKNSAPKTRPRTAAREDAIQLLTEDHKQVKTLFKSYEKLAEAAGSEEEKQALAEQICLMLTVHATAEEDIFYPAAREVLGGL
jgi:hypothetical protein